MNYSLPKDPYILFSFLNVMLRDRYSSLEEFCEDNDADIGEIMSKMRAAGFEYNESLNQFR